MAAFGPDLQAPLIVIGSGRSGTTLLMRALRAHPQMSFHGENDFLAPRLWRETVQNRFWCNWERKFRLDPPSAAVTLAPLDEPARSTLEERAAQLAAEHMAQLIGVRSDAQAWGYKELWNGSSWCDYDWAIYDAMFPRAVWVHLVRNPFAFAASAARWNVQPLTERHLRELLADWTRVQGKARERWQTGRYIRLRYEDMIARPQASLVPMLGAIGLDWDEACGQVFADWRFRSATSPFTPVERRAVRAEDYRRTIARFVGQCEDLGYLDPVELLIEAEAAPAPQRPHLRDQ